MLQTIYTVVTHTYWEHFGSQPSRFEFNTKAEAEAFANKYESDYFMEDGYYASMYKSTRVLITPEEEAKRLARQELRKTFNWKKDSFDYGIYTSLILVLSYFAGNNFNYYLFICNSDYISEEDKYYIYFLNSKDKYNLKDFPIEDGESLRTFKRIWL